MQKKKKKRQFSYAVVHAVDLWLGLFRLKGREMQVTLATTNGMY